MNARAPVPVARGGVGSRALTSRILEGECTEIGCGVAHGFWKRCAGAVARLREILRLCWWGRLRKGKGTAEDDLKPSVQSFSNRQSNH